MKNSKWVKFINIGFFNRLISVGDMAVWAWSVKKLKL
jgi:hypothetical protein